MLAKHHFQSYRTEGLIDGLGLKTLFAFFSAKAIRGGPRLLPQLAICVVILIILTRLLPNHFTDIAFGSNYTKMLKWRPSADKHEDGSAPGGLRIVVFGGGDIASPNKMPGNPELPDQSWTEILCEQLETCSSHLSYMPQTDIQGGSVISKALYGMALDKVVSSPNASQGPGYDYRWMQEQYPVPSHLPDLEEQVNTFLATPPPSHPPKETLWVFNFGYWDIWRMASLPSELAMDMIEVQVNHLFEQIELLYQKARSEDSIAYSDWYNVLDDSTAPDSENSTAVFLDVPAEPFRIFIASPFDVSLAPGFETLRFKPPHPHSRAEEMRNAVRLTDRWEKLTTEMIDAWLATPDPVVNGTRSEVALLEKRDASGNAVLVPNARREAITHDTPKYIRESLVDRQLRNAEIQDSNGLGTRPIDEGYLDVSEPCMPRDVPSNTTTAAHPKRTLYNQMVDGVCSLPNEHLFWTEFTVGQRAVNDIGKSAASRFNLHVQRGVQWLKKWQELPPLTAREFSG
ncbi:uncharacterized protein JN550_002988 [Neoarthrinium moseri]|uniref:uncharacterized protein n=1 Tax=Neoarthrinium moseri TaxID=1658444 RepID=UPI001FDC9019|nr:uncharacterized protein JN550_002988 [Neoarthrinium moseri]KAI1873719.1 hypothetical protein JN550_002988 [Neoarthrinium moseri]